MLKNPEDLHRESSSLAADSYGADSIRDDFLRNENGFL